MKELIRKILKEQTKEEEYNVLCLPYVGADRSYISGDIGDSRDGGARTHSGIDLMVDSGTQLIAPAAGKVSTNWVEKWKKCGSMVKIKHDGLFISPYTGKPVKLTTRYCHLSEITVTNGQRVKSGDVLGKTGGAASKVDGSRYDKNKDGQIVDGENGYRGEPSKKGTPSNYYREAGAGNSTLAHLHYEIYEDGQYVSGKIYVQGGGKFDYVPCVPIASDIVVDDEYVDDEYIDDSPDVLLDILKKKRKDDAVEPINITHNTCDDNTPEEIKEDFIILMKLKKLGYLEPKSSINSCITYEENVTAIKLYQEENGLPVGITGDCRIPIKTRNHVTDNDVEFVKS